MLIGVIGATGVLGRQVIPRLVENGHQVRAIVREPEAAERLRCTGVEPVIGDILAGDDLIPALASCDAALHLATAVPRPGQPLNWEINDRIRREGTRNFLNACRLNGVRRYVQQSITLVYGDHGYQIVGEEAQVHPSPVAQSALDAESLVREASLEWCILRGGSFYGPHTGREEAWREAALAKTLSLPGDGNGLISLVNVIDMARAVVTAVESAPAKSVYNVVDDHPVDYKTLYSYLSAQVCAAEPAPGGPVFLPSLGCSNQKIKVDLGWQPVFPSYRSGLA